MKKFSLSNTMWTRTAILVLIQAILLISVAWANGGEVLSSQEQDYLSPSIVISSPSIAAAFSGVIDFPLQNYKVVAESVSDDVVKKMLALNGTVITDKFGRDQYIVRVVTLPSIYPVAVRVERASDGICVGSVPVGVKENFKGDLILELGFADFHNAVIKSKDEKTVMVNYQGRGLFPKVLFLLTEIMPERSYLSISSIEETQTLKALASSTSWSSTRMGKIIDGCGWTALTLSIMDKSTIENFTLLDEKNKFPELYNPEGFRFVLLRAIRDIDQTDTIYGATFSATFYKGPKSAGDRGPHARSDSQMPDTFIDQELLTRFRNLSPKFFQDLFKDVWQELIGDIYGRLVISGERKAALERALSEPMNGSELTYQQKIRLTERLGIYSYESHTLAQIAGEEVTVAAVHSSIIRIIRNLRLYYAQKFLNVIFKELSHDPVWAGIISKYETIAGKVRKDPNVQMDLWGGREGAHSIYTLDIPEGINAQNFFNKMERAGLINKEQLTAMTTRQLAKMPRIGAVALAEIKEILAHNGRHLRDDIPGSVWNLPFERKLKTQICNALNVWGIETVGQLRLYMAEETLSDIVKINKRLSASIKRLMSDLEGSGQINRFLIKQDRLFVVEQAI